MSERDGWRHVYHYGYDGALKKQVTSGAFPVYRVVRVDPARRQIYMIASGDSVRPYDRHIYSVALDGTGFTALTSALRDRISQCSHHQAISSSTRTRT